MANKWNKTDPLKIDFKYIDSKGYEYIDHYYLIDGQFTDTPTNPQLLGVNDKNDFDKFDIDLKQVLSVLRTILTLINLEILMAIIFIS